MMWAMTSLWHLTTFSLTDHPTHPPTHPYLQQISLWLDLASWKTPKFWQTFLCSLPLPCKPQFPGFLHESFSANRWSYVYIPLCLWHSLDTCMTHTLVLSPATSPRVFVLCTNLVPVGQMCTFSAEVHLLVVTTSQREVITQIPGSPLYSYIWHLRIHSGEKLMHSGEKLKYTVEKVNTQWGKGKIHSDER